MSLAGRLSEEQVGELYQRLCEGETHGVVASPAIDFFYQELTAKHPEIDQVPPEKTGDFEYSPWSVAFDRSPGHILVSCVWPKADYVGELVREMAKRHGLTLYDPQSERVIFPTEATKPWWRFWG